MIRSRAIILVNRLDSESMEALRFILEETELRVPILEETWANPRPVSVAHPWDGIMTRYERMVGRVTVSLWEAMKAYSLTDKEYEVCRSAYLAVSEEWDEIVDNKDP